MDIQEILQLIKENDVKAIRFETVNIHGISISKTVHARYFEEKAKAGVGIMIGSCFSEDLKGTTVLDTGFLEEIGFSDCKLFPCLETFRILPWNKRIARILTEPKLNGEIVTAHPRVIARRQLERLRNRKFSLLSSHEYEVTVVDKKTHKLLSFDLRCYVSSELIPYEDLALQIFDYLTEIGLDVECAESEAGPGQIEITYKPAFGIRAADNAHTFRGAIKELSLRNGYIASFMSRPFKDVETGSSCSICHSLWDEEGKVPLLHDAGHPSGLSEVGRYWIAGLLTHAPAITVLMAPTVNCLSRFKPWSFNPTNATWGIDNRSCAMRVKLDDARGSYIENRLGASGCNPYLALAATIAAGLDGIEKKIPLPPPVSGNAYVKKNILPNAASIPTEMETALNQLAKDDVITEALGKEFVKAFTALKRHESTLAAEAQVNGHDDWETDYFFDFL